MSKFLGVARGTFYSITGRNIKAPFQFISNWILATGFWNDNGIWKDSSNWID